MNAMAPRARTARFAVYFFGVLAAVAYGVLLIPALLGRHPNQQAFPGQALVSAAFFYCLWTYRGRKAWEGAILGLGIFLVAAVSATYLSGINPAH